MYPPRRFWADGRHHPGGRRLVGYGQAGAVGDGPHQVLQVGKDMGVGFVAVFGNDVAVDDDIELAVRPGGELKGGDMVADPAQGFASHPGGAQGVASILAVKDFQFQFPVGRHFTPPNGLRFGV